jgi:hypothetical protein
MKSARVADWDSPAIKQVKTHIAVRFPIVILGSRWDFSSCDGSRRLGVLN